jgi:cytoskeletal protein CcmA (bactofilin family)
MAEGELVSRLVTVLPGGSVRAATNADTVQVAGVVEGDIHARLVDVSSLGELKGAVSAAQIRVLPGATLAGAALKIG